MPNLGNNSDADPSPRSARRAGLAAAWKDQDKRAFWRLVNDDLGPDLVVRLAGRFRLSGLSREDVEDCWQTSLEPFIEPNDLMPADPEAYIRRSVINACLQELRTRRRRKPARFVLETEYIRKTGMRPAGRGAIRTRSGDVEGEVRIDRQSATVVVEEIMQDVEVDPRWTVGVVEAALQRLRPALRRVAAYVMANDADVREAVAAHDLGISAKSYRSNKSKAFKALRQILPQVIQNQGVVLTPREAETIFAEPRHRGPDPEDEEPIEPA